MAFNVTSLRYGWVYLTALGTLGLVGTIYMLNPTRHQVAPEDIIEIVLGVHERCLATQTATNPTYSVDPPSIVRTWYSNVYTTNGVIIYTNVVTNAIGFSLDRSMMVSLDATIKQLVPYYCDTNSVYDGSTQICMLTVTGLWASLEIGDKTNQFTREPTWTNPVSTNWVVNYTSYWPSTNGTATNICYTSDYRQAINYAASWTATGGHVWVTSSNWASSVVTITNAATYGDYPWQIYTQDLEERYKVLEALKATQQLPDSSYQGSSRNVGGYVHTMQEWQYSNKITSELISGYSPSWQAKVLSLTPDYDLSSDTNYAFVRRIDFYVPSWDQIKTCAEWRWYYGVSNYPPYRISTNYTIVDTNKTGLAVGHSVNADVTVDYLLDGEIAWQWYISATKQYATWRWKDIKVADLTNSLAIYVKPRATSWALETEVATTQTWMWPRIWNTNIAGDFVEFNGMTNHIFYKMADSNIKSNGNYKEIQFGSDEFDPLAGAGTFPAWCDEPTKGVDELNNSGSIGQVKGAYLFWIFGGKTVTWLIHYWQFTCATNKYW